MTGKIKTLIVDDEPEIIKTIQRYLSFYEGIALFTASSFEEAVAIISEEEPRIVITDVNLGDGSGLDLIKRSRKFTNATQVIVITGASDATRVVDALEQGAVDYIKKPIDMEELKDRIDEACERIKRWEALFIDELRKCR